MSTPERDVSPERGGESVALFKGPLKGHRLRDEGKTRDPFSYWGVRGGEGVGLCSCGTKSPVLPSTSQRQKWHRQHKAEMASLSARPES